MATATYQEISHLVPQFEWDLYQPLIEKIQAKKKEVNAVLLAHNYQTPEIFHGVADFKGDSLGLAQQAAECDADIIVFCGVHFMAETAKILNPQKMVLIPDLRAGCSLAESITGEDVRKLRAQYPGVPAVCYVNTSAEVKAECDACCTSSNAVTVVESMGSDKVIFLPDEYLASYVDKLTEVEIIRWHGRCEVHERFTPADIANYREQFPGLTVMGHPECSPEVIEACDMVGSTAGMANYVRDHQPRQVALITECSMSDNLATQFPQVEFVRPCNMCPHMKRITLHNILESLENFTHQVEVDPEVARRAKVAVDRMLAIGRGEGR